MSVFNRFPLVSRIFLFLVFPVLLAVFFFYLRIEKSLPVDEKTIFVEGLMAPTEVKRDEHGVVYISAEDEQDVYFTMGFAHASDRLWQLEIQRRIARGEMSELFGSRFLNQDIWIQTLGIFESTESAWDSLSPSAQNSLKAYASGIQAWLDTHDTLPIEFTLFNIKPGEWTPRDSLAWIKIFALNLSGNMYGEINRSVAKQILSSQQFKDLYPDSSIANELSFSWDRPEYVNFISGLASQKRFSEHVMKIGGPNVGSNCWVVAGRHTNNGKPFLVNDPHLGLQIPSLWYVVDQSSPAFHVAGMSLVGLPTVIFGRNDHIAWGGTNMMADAQDLYIERLDPKDPNRYLSVDGQWKNFETINKKIHVRADFPSPLREALMPVSLNVRHTQNGPVISEAGGALDFTVSLSWTALKPNDSSYDAFFQITHAKNWQDFKNSAALLHAPVLNMLYVDSEHIGYFGAGKIPIRGKGNGTEPVPGWEKEYQWKSYIPAFEMPQQYDPSSGVIISANNDPTDGAFPHHISSEWALPLRAERIEKLITGHIKSTGHISIDQQGDIQQDQFDAGVLALVNNLAIINPVDPRLQSLIQQVRQWDGYMQQDSPVALLLSIWLPELNKQLFEDEFTSGFLQKSKSAQLQGMLSTIPYTLTLDALNQKTNANWCDDVSTELNEQCIDILNKSFEQAVASLDKFLGGDINNWKLGEAQNTTYENVAFSQTRLLNKMFGREIANGGSGNSINVATSSFEKAEGLKQKIGASFRQIISIDEKNTQHLYMNSTGQSGNIISKHYDDMVEPFNRVNFYKLSSLDPEVITSKYQLSPR